MQKRVGPEGGGGRGVFSSVSTESSWKSVKDIFTQYCLLDYSSGMNEELELYVNVPAIAVNKQDILRHQSLRLHWKNCSWILHLADEKKAYFQTINVLFSRSSVVGHDYWLQRITVSTSSYDLSMNPTFESDFCAVNTFLGGSSGKSAFNSFDLFATQEFG